MKRFLKTRFAKGTLAFVLVVAMLPFTMLLMPQVQAMESFSVPVGGFNSGNTGTTENRDVRISGNAALSGGGVRLVANAGNQRGGVFFTNPIKQGTGFSASFQMRMGAGSAQNADGFTFVMAANTNQVGAIGQGIGYSGIGRSVAIEFDTFDNRSGGGNGTVPHIWYGINGTMDTADNNRLVVFEPTATRGTVSRFRNVKNYTVHGWIEYNPNGHNENPELVVTYSSRAERPQYPTLILRGGTGTNGWDSNDTYVVYDKNFTASTFGEQYYVGFTAATGGSMQETTLLSFSAFGQLTEYGGSRTIIIDGQEVDIGTGIDLPQINPDSIPKPDGLDEDSRFQGLYNEDGIQYYDENGNPVHVNDLEEDDELFARFSSTVKLRNQGAMDGSLNVTTDQPLPSTLAEGGASIPIRDGFIFKGYYDDIAFADAETTKYYDESGNRVVDEDFLWQPFNPEDEKGGPNTLYAQWLREGAVTVTIDAGGGIWTSPSAFNQNGNTGNSAALTPGTSIAIPRPVRDNHVFGGWAIAKTIDSAEGAVGASINGNILTIVGGENATLTAVWHPIQSVVAVEGTHSGANQDRHGLGAAFEQKNLVHDNLYGVTAAELLAGTVTLTLHINDSLGNSDGAKAIRDLAEEAFGRGLLDKLTFYDIYVEKQINNEEPIKLRGLPQPVTVRIPLTEELAGASGYTVFQYHVDDDAGGRAGRISAYEGDAFVDNGHLVLQLKRFSDFAVLPNAKHIHFTGEHFAEHADPDNCPFCRFGLDEVMHQTTVGNWDDFDVQARIINQTDPKYKLDIEWGDMKFTFSLDYMMTWTGVDGHEYIEDRGERVNDWVLAGYTGGNNRITVTNHSNDGVFVSFASDDDKKAEFLAEIDIVVTQQNQADSLPALEMPLARAPRGGPAPSIDAYLRMSGNPDVDEFKKAYETALREAYNLDQNDEIPDDAEVWLKVAVITVTVVPEKGELTP